MTFLHTGCPASPGSARTPSPPAPAHGRPAWLRHCCTDDGDGVKGIAIAHAIVGQLLDRSCRQLLVGRLARLHLDVVHYRHQRSSLSDILFSILLVGVKEARCLSRFTTPLCTAIWTAVELLIFQLGVAPSRPGSCVSFLVEVVNRALGSRQECVYATSGAASKAGCNYGSQKCATSFSLHSAGWPMARSEFRAE